MFRNEASASQAIEAGATNVELSFNIVFPCYLPKYSQVSPKIVPSLLIPLFSTIGFSSAFSFLHTTSTFLGQQLRIAILHSILSYHSNSAWITLAWFCTLYCKSACLDKDLRDCVAIVSSDDAIKSHVRAFISQPETFLSHSRAFVSHLDGFNSRLKALNSFWEMNRDSMKGREQSDNVAQRKDF